MLQIKMNDIKIIFFNKKLRYFLILILVIIRRIKLKIITKEIINQLFIKKSKVLYKMKHNIIKALIIRKKSPLIFHLRYLQIFLFSLMYQLFLK